MRQPVCIAAIAILRFVCEAESRLKATNIPHRKSFRNPTSTYKAKSEQIVLGRSIYFEASDWFCSITFGFYCGVGVPTCDNDRFPTLSPQLLESALSPRHGMHHDQRSPVWAMKGLATAYWSWSSEKAAPRARFLDPESLCGRTIPAEHKALQDRKIFSVFIYISCK